MTKFKVGDRVKNKLLGKVGIIYSLSVQNGYYIDYSIDDGLVFWASEENLFLIPEPKFKVGDRVQYTSANLVTLSNKKLTRYDIGTIKDVTKKPDIWYVEFENGNFYVEEKNLIKLIGESKMEDLTDLKRKYEELGKEIEKIEKQKNEDYVLKLEVIERSNCLVLCYYANGLKVDIGHISSLGNCYILNDTRRVSGYEKWRANGMKVCSDKVEWKGKRYFVGIFNKNIQLCSTTLDGDCFPTTNKIYDFTDCYWFSGVTDDNIVRFKHNNRPIGF